MSSQKLLAIDLSCLLCLQLDVWPCDGVCDEQVAEGSGNFGSFQV